MGKPLLVVDANIIYKHIEAEFGKKQTDIEDCINILEEWFKTQPHLPEQPNRTLIRAFLFFNKFSIERCKEKLDMYYTIRNKLPEMFQYNPASAEMIKNSKVSYIVPLPKLAPDNRRIIFCKFSDQYGPEDFDMEKYLCHILNTFEVLMREDLFLGSHFVVDAGSVKMGHVTKVNPMTLKKSSVIMEKVYTNRVASIHCINFYPALETTMNIIKSIIPAKIAKRFHYHKNAEALFSIFPKSIIPSDIGGDESSLDELNNRWIEKFGQYKDLFDKLGAMRVNESLRPTRLVNDEVLGYYGNFKKLDVD
ncbi:alpha-tocopherol transfer protein-like [Sitophilus oryzae]|uniref:Alpha-tocopherol transfer protein-like n=1 Tax=Sitophilus oryzae TaxID=7048 RepID=A0A6J2XZB6_SITOR|nr:alpha-tocopherol transfer protein-like [Sitophilus oryzae]